MIRINLLPVREERRKADLRQFAALLLLTVFASVAVAGLLHMQMTTQAKRAQARVAAIQQQIDRYTPQLEQVKKYKKTKKRIEKKLAVIAELEQKRSGPVRMLDELATHTPEKLWITRLEAQGRRISLSGMSLANELVASFLESLSNSAYFSNVELLQTNATKKRGIKVNEFELKASLVTPEKDGRGDVQQTAATATPAGPYGR